MARRGSGLAARFRTAVAHDEADQRAALELADRDLEAARAERDTLLDDLEALGAELPITGVERDATGVRYLHGEHVLRFAPDEAAGVDVSYTSQKTGDVQRLYQQQELGGRWVWSRVWRGRESRLPLFDQALEILLVHALGLPELASTPEGSSFDDTGAVAASDDRPAGKKRSL